MPLLVHRVTHVQRKEKKEAKKCKEKGEGQEEEAGEVKGGVSSFPFPH